MVMVRKMTGGPTTTDERAAATGVVCMGTMMRDEVDRGGPVFSCRLSAVSKSLRSSLVGVFVGAL